MERASTTRKNRKVVIEYTTDESDDQREAREPTLEFDTRLHVTKTVRVTLPAMPSQVHFSQTFVQRFLYYGMCIGLRQALEECGWTTNMIDEFIANFRVKHGFNCMTALLPYDDEEDSDGQPIYIDGGKKMVLK